MNKKQVINEGLDFHDMENLVEPVLSVDEYVAKMGKDKDIITLAFEVKAEKAGQDLVDWFERGYDWVLDSSLSEGEVEVGKFLVFVELSRRSSATARIIDLLKDLKTLTNIKLTQWTVRVDDEEYDADEQILKQVIILNPNLYKTDQENEEELNEVRKIAGLSHKDIHSEDAYIKNIKAMAGL